MWRFLASVVVLTPLQPHLASGTGAVDSAGWPSDPKYETLGHAPCRGDELYRSMPHVCAMLKGGAPFTDCRDLCEASLVRMSRCMGFQVDVNGYCCIFDRDWQTSEVDAFTAMVGQPTAPWIFENWGTHLTRVVDDWRLFKEMGAIASTACFRRRVNCTAAPNCTGLHRYPCELGKLANTCDWCKPRFLSHGEPPHTASNHPCEQDPDAAPPKLRIGFSTAALVQESDSYYEGSNQGYISIGFALNMALEAESDLIPIPVEDRQNFTVELVGFCENATKIALPPIGGTGEVTTDSVMPGLAVMTASVGSILERKLQMRQTSPPGQPVHAFIGQVDSVDSEKEFASAADTYHVPLLGFNFADPKFLDYPYYVRTNKVALDFGLVMGDIFKLLNLTRIYVFEQVVAPRLASQIRATFPPATVIADGPDQAARGPCWGDVPNCIKESYRAWVRLRAADARIIAHEQGGEAFENVIPLLTDIMGPKVLYLSSGRSCDFLSLLDMLQGVEGSNLGLTELYNAAGSAWQGPRCTICKNIARGFGLSASELANKTLVAEHLYSEDHAADFVAACPMFPNRTNFDACQYCDTRYQFFASPPCWDLLKRYDYGYANSMCIQADTSQDSVFYQRMLNYMALVGEDDFSDNSTEDGLRAVERLKAAGLPPSYLETFEPGGHMWELGLDTDSEMPLSWTDAWVNRALLAETDRGGLGNAGVLNIADALLTLIVAYNEWLKNGGDADERSQAWWPSADFPNSYGFLRYLLGVSFGGVTGRVEYMLTGTRNLPYNIFQTIRAQSGGCKLYLTMRNETATPADTMYSFDVVGAYWNFASVPLTSNLSGLITWKESNLIGCNPFPADFFRGKFAFIARGTCQFATKLLNVQAAGALAMILWNKQGDNPQRMFAVDSALQTAGFTAGNPDGVRVYAMLKTGLPVYAHLSGSTVCVDPTHPETAGLEAARRTMTFNPALELLTIPAGNITFNDGTTIPPLQVPNPCKTGEAYNWSSRECEACRPGFSLPPGSSTCLSCPAGSFSNVSASTACTLCELGQFSNASSGYCSQCEVGTVAPLRGAPKCAPCLRGQYFLAAQCESCAPGQFSENEASTACALCPAGFFITETGRSACNGCLQGTFQAKTGSTACIPCNVTTYQPEGSSTQCLPCENVIPGSVAPGLGTYDPEQCQCPLGTFFSRPQRNGSSSCRPCLEGLTCPGGLDEHGKCCEPPKQAERLHVGKPEYPGGPFPFFIYCADATKCPAGRALGECPPHSEGRACDYCTHGYTYSAKAGGCIPCEGGTSFWPLFLTIIVFICVLVAMVFYAAKEISVQAQTMVTIALTFSLCANVLQVLGAFRLLRLSWPEPLTTLYDVLKVVTFDVDLLNPNCVFKTVSPDLTYTGALLAHPFFAVTLLLIFGILKILPGRFKRRVTKPQVANAQGLVILSLYICMSMVSVKPWQCESNPDGTSSVVSFRVVQCWSKGHHQHMIALSVCGILIYDITFIAVIAWATYVYPIRITQPGGINFLRYFRFLFDRFKPDSYSYGLLYCCRNLLLAIIPVALVNEVSAQVMATGMVVMSTALVQAWLQPWRSEMPNFVDSVASLSLMLILMGGAILINGTDSEGKAVVQGFFVVLLVSVISMFSSVVLYNVWRILRPPRPFGIFLSHHKVGAAVLSRWFKLQLATLTKDQIFYDSDNLRHLDKLFEVCAFQTKNVVVLLTRETLRRIWCAGEIVSAHVHKVPVVLVACNDYTRPTTQFIEHLDDEWTDMQKLEVARLGITMEQIKAAYYDFLTKPVLELDRTARLDQQRQVVEEVFARCKGLGMTALGLMGTFGLARTTNSSANLKNSQTETSSTSAPVMLYGEAKEPEDRMVGAVVVILLQKQLGISVYFAENAEEAYDEGLRTTQYLMVLLTRGVLDNPAAGALIAKAARRRNIELLPLNFDPSFAFPSTPWYDALVFGEIYPADDPRLRDVSLERVQRAYVKLFSVLSLRFTPHGSENLQKTEVSEMAPRFSKILKRMSQSAKEGDSKEEGYSVEVHSTLSRGATGSLSMSRDFVSGDLPGPDDLKVSGDLPSDGLPSGDLLMKDELQQVVTDMFNVHIDVQVVGSVMDA